MNAYDVALMSGGFVDVEADFYELDGDDYVFLSAEGEVKRIPRVEVMSVSKSTLRPRVPEPNEKVWI
jgi:hypothetical protein